MDRQNETPIEISTEGEQKDKQKSSEKFMIRCGNGHGVLEPNTDSINDLSTHLPKECPVCGHTSTQPALNLNIEYTWFNLITRMLSIGLFAVIAGVLYSNSNGFLSLLGIIIGVATFFQFANFMQSKPYIFEFGDQLKIVKYGKTKLNIHKSQVLWVSLFYQNRGVLKPEDLVPGAEIRFFLTDRSIASFTIGLNSFETYSIKIKQMLAELQDGWKIAY